ncbi:MAG TPA: exodeoxyribonuclease VII large subunit, partial [Candidatus Acidoferrales bacterium]|nr:exodeoxyribonuclease VII large subunit [Candidatus Acidoferrales bacterium]
VELRGLGALQAAFEKLKQKLAAEGLFTQERKRALPPFPRRIGLVTSPTGAAIRDVLHVIRRRNPGLEIILAACRVQGDGAAREIANAIQLLNEFSTGQGLSPANKSEGKLDLVLVTRGGGSLEDLWAFNEEIVARAIFESALPVVSAVGHEIDFTIADFVADLRAATPSAAAEIITEGVFSSGKFVAQCGERMGQLVRRRMTEKVSFLRQQSDRLARAHPRRKLQNWQQRLDDLHSDLSRCLIQRARQSGVLLKHLWERLHRIRPSHFLKQRREQLRQLERRLNALGPEQVLGRGYSITMDAGTGKVLRDAKKVKASQKLKTRLKTGEIISRAEG